MTRRWPAEVGGFLAAGSIFGGGERLGAAWCVEELGAARGGRRLRAVRVGRVGVALGRQHSGMVHVWGIWCVNENMLGGPTHWWPPTQQNKPN